MGGGGYRLTLPPGRTIRGKVVDDRGRPIVGARVTARTTGARIDPPKGIYLPNHEKLDLTYVRALTRLGGAFTLTGVGEASVDVTASKRTYPELLRPALEVAPDTEGLKLVLLRPFVAALTVVDADTNEPIPHVSVKIDVPGEEGEEERAPYEGATDLEGRFEKRLDFPAARAPDVNVRISIYSEEHGEDVAEGVPLERLDEERGFAMTLVKKDPATLRLKVVYDNGEPYRQWSTFELKPAAGPQFVRWARREEDGYAVLKVRPGTYEYIRARGYAGDSVDSIENIALRPAEQLERTLTIERGGDLDITFALKEKGQGQLRGGRVEILSGEQNQVRGLWSNRAVFIDVRPGEAKLTVTHPDYEIVEKTITVTKGERTALTIPLKKK
jgi:hypothetical protein